MDAINDSYNIFTFKAATKCDLLLNQPAYSQRTVP